MPIASTSSILPGNLRGEFQTAIGPLSRHELSRHSLEGSVDSIGWALPSKTAAQASSSVAVKPTFSGSDSQRIPVMVHIKKVPENIKLRAGTKASVLVITGTSTVSDQVPPVPRVLQ
jgi:hypothetical protein